MVLFWSRQVMEEGALQAPWLEVRGNHDNFDVKAPGGVQAHARSSSLIVLVFKQQRV